MSLTATSILSSSSAGFSVPVEWVREEGRGERERDSICTSEILMEPPQRKGDR